MSHPLKNRTKKEISEKASRLKRLAKLDVDFSVIEKAARDLMLGHIEWVGAYHIRDLYRGRKWRYEKLPTNISELLAKKPEDITEYGRLNIPRQSLLYVGEITQTVMNELRLKDGDHVVFIRLVKKDESPNFRISRLGMLPQDTSFASLSAREKEILEEVGGHKNYKKLIEMRKCLSKLFKTVVDDSNKSFYKITAALGHNHFKEEEIHGVMYPSVTTRYFTCNLAVRPSVVDSIFNPHSVAFMKVVKTEWDYHHVDTLKTGWVGENGDITWDDSLAFECPALEGMEFKEMELSGK